MTNSQSEYPPSRSNLLTQNLLRWIKAFDIKGVVYPLLGIVIFCLLWSLAASRIDTSLG
ncbi:MAG: hypothetical protein ACJARN_000271, partial [Arenicella sp.]